MTRMRTIDQAIDELRRDDPCCALTKNALRQMIISKRIPSVNVGSGQGSKYLINMDTLEAFLQAPQSVGVDLEVPGKIRRIN